MSDELSARLPPKHELEMITALPEIVQECTQPDDALQSIERHQILSTRSGAGLSDCVGPCE